jgi:spermidine synthase
MGDARLTLAKQPDQSFDLIVLDAFSSDAIPIHLLTLEAFQTYLKKLKPGGVIAVHISNRYLDLQPVLKAAAKELKLQSALFEDGAMTDEIAAGKASSIWVTLARNEADLAPLLKDRNWGEVYGDTVRPWTDDYSNVLGVFAMDD